MRHRLDGCPIMPSQAEGTQPTAATSLTLWAVTEVTNPIVTVMGDDAVGRHNGYKQ